MQWRKRLHIPELPLSGEIWPFYLGAYKRSRRGGKASFVSAA